jgi:hypothetical protein
MKSKVIVLIAVGGILVCALLFIPRRTSNETESEKAALVHAPPNSSSQQKTEAEVVAIAEIQGLIPSLSDRKFAVREAASKRLIEFGMDAIPELQKGQTSPDPEIRKRSRKIIQEIERLNNVVNGAEFRVVTEPVWRIPKPGEETKIKIGILFKNRTKEERLVFYLVDKIHPILRDSNGQTIKLEGGRNGIYMTTNRILSLQPEESYEFLYPDARLSWANQGKELGLYLISSGFEWLYVPGLSSGHYSISFRYENTDVPPVEGDWWVGEAITPPVKVEIK